MDAILQAPKQPDRWYREPWLLLVLGGPLLVVLACIITAWLAWHGADPVLDKNYYQSGLRINQELDKQAKLQAAAAIEARAKLGCADIRSDCK